ncbi:MAG: dockerin type I repeat-containing protein [Ruminococcus sp.]|nr:dockerin type I repeat-containing protein [Ruminococcus sp.]
MKKFTAVFLAALMLFGMLPFTAFAASGPSEATYAEDEYIAYVTIFNYALGVRYGIFKNNEAHNDVLEGVSYDRASNTLTLSNFNHPEFYLGTNMMGDDFALKIEGECALGAMYIYGDHWGGSLRFTGTGTLTVNESRNVDAAVEILAEDSNSSLHFDKDVTVKLYGTENLGGIIATQISSQSDAVVLDNGQTMDVTGRRNIYEDKVWVRSMQYHDYGFEMSQGFRIKSASDPDGIYIAEFIPDMQKYLLQRYIYIDLFDCIMYDQSFESNSMTAEQLAQKGYTFVMAPDKVSLEYFDKYSYEHRGYIGVQLTKNDDPDSIYVLEVNPEHRDIEYMTQFPVCRVHWDNEEKIYVKDDIPTEQLEAEEFRESYTIVTEEHSQQKTFECWYYPELPPSEEDGNYLNHPNQLALASEPDEIYIQIGTYGHSNPETGEYIAEGYLINKPFYNEEYDVYYNSSLNEEENECIEVAFEDFEDSGFSFVSETVSSTKTLNYIDDDFRLSTSALVGSKVKKASNPDDVYVGLDWMRDGVKAGYSISRVVWNEEKGFYFMDEATENTDLTFEEFENSDYSFVVEDQPAKYYTRGYISTNRMSVCEDADGGKHLLEWDEVYDYSEDNTLTVGDQVYYLVTPNKSLSEDDVTEETQTVVTDTYNYIFNGTEFIYSGSGTPEPTYVLGDVNGDSKVDVNDATMVQMIAAELLVPNDVQKLAGDVNRDGKVDINDATLIQQFAAEIIEHF